MGRPRSPPILAPGGREGSASGHSQACQPCAGLAPRDGEGPPAQPRGGSQQLLGSPQYLPCEGQPGPASSHPQVCAEEAGGQQGLLTNKNQAWSAVTMCSEPWAGWRGTYGAFPTAGGMAEGREGQADGGVGGIAGGAGDGEQGLCPVERGAGGGAEGDRALPGPDWSLLHLQSLPQVPRPLIPEGIWGRGQAPPQHSSCGEWAEGQREAWQVETVPGFEANTF